MYGKYSLFYESHKNQGYYAHVQTVSTRPLFRGEWPGDEATMFHDASFRGSVWHAASTNHGYKLVGGAMCEMKLDFCCLFY